MDFDFRVAGREELPHEFLREFEAHLRGAITAERLCRTIRQVVGDDAGRAETIHEVLDAALRRGRISQESFEALSAAADERLADDLPTVQPRIAASANEHCALAEPIPCDMGDAPPILRQRVASRRTVRPLAPGDMLRDRFLLVACVRRGGMGIIFKAVDQLKAEAGVREPWTAVKVIRHDDRRFASALAGLQHEAESAQRLSHPNVIRVHDFDRCKDHYFMTMEWLDGRSLASLLADRPGRPLPELQSKIIIRGLASGLAHAHRHGVIHADVKPGNVFVLRNGQPKLLDFGASRFVERHRERVVYSVSAAHTPAYASCEVLEGRDPAERDDLFSFACVVYRILAGHRPFGELTALAAEQAGCRPARIPGLADHRWETLNRALAFRRIGRQRNVDQFIDEYFADPAVATTAARDPGRPAQPRIPVFTGVPAVRLSSVAAPPLLIAAVGILLVLLLR